MYATLLPTKWLILVREQLKDLTKQYDKSENDLKALQSVGQIVGEVLKQLTEEKCKDTCILNLLHKNQFNFGWLMGQWEQNLCVLGARSNISLYLQETSSSKTFDSFV